MLQQPLFSLLKYWHAQGQGMMGPRTKYPTRPTVIITLMTRAQYEYQKSSLNKYNSSSLIIIGFLYQNIPAIG